MSIQFVFLFMCFLFIDYYCSFPSLIIAYMLYLPITPIHTHFLHPIPYSCYPIVTYLPSIFPISIPPIPFSCTSSFITPSLFLLPYPYISSSPFPSPPYLYQHMTLSISISYTYFPSSPHPKLPITHSHPHVTLSSHLPITPFSMTLNVYITSSSLSSHLPKP